MLLNSLEMVNFRQYKGTQKVEFSTDQNKNVTLLLGKNTSGKTTIIQAFRWALYGDCNFTGNKSEKKYILNNDVRRNMRSGDIEIAKVVLVFEHRHVTYELYRSYEYKSKVSGDASFDSESYGMYSYENGEKVKVKGSDTKIEEILPQSLAEYFFFDGEKISKSRDTGNVKNSINTIMGLVPLEHMKGHLMDNRTNVANSYRNSMKKDSGVAEINRNITICEGRIKDAEDNLADAQNRYDNANKGVDERAKEMVEVETVAKDAERLRLVDSKIEVEQKRLKSDEAKIIETSTDAIAEVIANMVSDEILDKMKSFEYDDKGIPEMTAVSVNYIMERGKCICGADLKDHPECVEELKELLLYLPPESIGSQIRQLSQSLQGLSGMSKAQELREAYHSTYEDRMVSIEGLDDERQELSLRIGKNRDADRIKADYDRLKKNRDLFDKERLKYRSECDRLKLELEELNRNLARAGSSDDFNKAIMAKMEYVKALFERADEAYGSNSDEIFCEFRATLEDVFNSMYHGERTIELTDSYKVELSVGGERLDKSKGLDTVQNFAFISTLLKVARGRMDTELESEPYPLAMDAVFSNTDEIHIINICKELPKLAEQAVLAIMDKDWAIAAQALENSVGRKYAIDKVSETQSVIREVQRWPRASRRRTTGTRSVRRGISGGSTRST